MKIESQRGSLLKCNWLSQKERIHRECPIKALQGSERGETNHHGSLGGRVEGVYWSYVLVEGGIRLRDKSLLTQRSYEGNW